MKTYITLASAMRRRIVPGHGGREWGTPAGGRTGRFVESFAGALLAWEDTRAAFPVHGREWRGPWGLQQGAGAWVPQVGTSG
jgi:hypothetical protein